MFLEDIFKEVLLQRFCCVQINPVLHVKSLLGTFTRTQNARAELRRVY